MEKKRLLFVISQLYRGGAEQATINLLKMLQKEEYHIDLLVLNQAPIQGAVSLMSEIPLWIRTCNAYEADRTHRFAHRIKKKLLFTPTQLNSYPISALEFIYRKQYDWAFHIGEWSNPSFVAREVYAKNKALWIHNDLSLAEYFAPDSFFANYELFSHCIFVSKNSLENSCNLYPFLRKKAHVIYNVIDFDSIRRRSVEAVDENKSKPLVVTVANIRQQKQHIKQLEVMRILKNEGFDFEWWNIGALTDSQLVSNLRARISEYGLDKDFLLLGSKDNPYKYIKKSDIVACLSDYESWCLVITEAMVLGKPVLATKTSGAIEQIIDGETGILTEFDVGDMVLKLKGLLMDADKRTYIESNSRCKDMSQEILQSFEELINIDTQGSDSVSNIILYIIDDVNYIGGAHLSTLTQIDALCEIGKNITVFSTVNPTIKLMQEHPHIDFISWQSVEADKILHRKLLHCLLDNNLSKMMKKLKISTSVCVRRHHSLGIAFERYIKPATSSMFSKYHTNCIMSEGSQFKEQVANSSARYKIQWIHTDYCAWRNSSDYARMNSVKDKEIWSNFDKIVVLSLKFQNDLANLFPYLKDKIVVLPNLLKASAIIQYADEVQKNRYFVKFVTVGRFEAVKAIPRLLYVLCRLKENGYTFQWDFVGDGDELNVCRELTRNYGLAGVVTFLGAKKNPYPFIKRADVFGLLSYYEGLPNTIFEALILGKPVVATNVGGISDQVTPGLTGWLAENNDDSIYDTLVYILEHKDEVEEFTENLKQYVYENNQVMSKLKDLFGEKGNE